jgi:hypothetical protein
LCLFSRVQRRLPVAAKTIQKRFKHPYVLCAEVRTLIIKEKEHEENLSTEQNQKSAYPWIPFADGHQGRTPGDQQAPRQRPQTLGPVKVAHEYVNGNQKFYVMTPGWFDCLQRDGILKLYPNEKRSPRTTGCLSGPISNDCSKVGNGPRTGFLSFISAETISSAVAWG